MSESTPGPWFVDPQFPLCVRPSADSADDRRPGRLMVDNVEVVNLNDDYGHRERGQDRVAFAEAFRARSFYRSYEEAKANARLIAATPDLLAACEAARKHIVGEVMMSKASLTTLDTLRRAIKKAEDGE